MQAYIVVGLFISDDEIFTSISRYGVKSDLKSAMKELEIIKKEFIKEAKENGNRILSSKVFDTKISFELDNGTIEEYEIMERTIDFKD